MRSCGNTREPRSGVCAAANKCWSSTTANGPKWPFASNWPTASDTAPTSVSDRLLHGMLRAHVGSVERAPGLLPAQDLPDGRELGGVLRRPSRRVVR